MAHSIIAASDEQAAATAGARVYVSDEVHRMIWSDRTGQGLPAPYAVKGYQVGRFPMLSRLADPYRDATIHAGEVAAFRQELMHVLEGGRVPDEGKQLLEQAVALSRRAEEEGWPLLCHGD